MSGVLVRVDGRGSGSKGDGIGEPIAERDRWWAGVVVWPTRGADVKFPRNGIVLWREARRVFGAIVVCVYYMCTVHHVSLTAATRQPSNSTSPSPFHGRAT
jgi:hypothetical protein